MSRICLTLKMELKEDLLFSSSNGMYGSAAFNPILDSEGRPFMPGSTLKGLLRESIENYLCWTGQNNADILKQLFFSHDHSRAFSHRIIFQDLVLAQDCVDWSATRKRIRIKNGSLNSISSILCVRAGTCFYGSLLCDSKDRELIEIGLSGIHWAGSMRNRGMGRVRISVCHATTPSETPSIPASHWIRYRLKVKSPMIIPKSAHAEDHIQSRSYLPGSAVRGMVMNYLHQHSPKMLQQLSGPLLNQVFFRNALPTLDGIELIPTPKGFYSDKQQTSFYSVLNEDVHPGHKRADLGSFCYLEEDTLCHFSPAIEQRIRASKQNGTVIIAQAIGTGTELTGYIYLQDPSLAPLVASAFSESMQFGTFRYAGNGQCELLSLDTQAPDHFRYGFQSKDPIEDELYMLLLSGGTMLRHGQPCGMDPIALAALLEVPEVVVHRCATSIAEFSGFNTLWKSYLPTSVMYAPGSIFRLSFPQGAPTGQVLSQLQQTGFGLRTTEGFGQVLFLKNFPQIRTALQAQASSTSLQQSARFRAIRCAWLIDTPIPGEASGNSLRKLMQLGHQTLSGDPRAKDTLYARLHLGEEAHIQKRLQRRDSFAAIRRILEQPLSETLQCPEYPDHELERIRLMVDWIEAQSRRGY